MTTWTASFGIAAVIMGGAGCLGGLTATGIIKASEMLNPYRSTIQKALFYGGVASGRRSVKTQSLYFSTVPTFYLTPQLSIFTYPIFLIKKDLRRLEK